MVCASKNGDFQWFSWVIVTTSFHFGSSNLQLTLFPPPHPSHHLQAWEMISEHFRISMKNPGCLIGILITYNRLWWFMKESPNISGQILKKNTQQKKPKQPGVVFQVVWEFYWYPHLSVPYKFWKARGRVSLPDIFLAWAPGACFQKEPENDN